MTPALERAARAAADLFGPGVSTETGAVIARTVLMAVREPDRRWAADACVDLVDPDLTFNPAPATAFTAMIDAILSEPQPTKEGE